MKNAHNQQHIFIISLKTKITNLNMNPVILQQQNLLAGSNASPIFDLTQNCFCGTIVSKQVHGLFLIKEPIFADRKVPTF